MCMRNVAENEDFHILLWVLLVRIRLLSGAQRDRTRNRILFIGLARGKQNIILRYVLIS